MVKLQKKQFGYSQFQLWIVRIISLCIGIPALALHLLVLSLENRNLSRELLSYEGYAALGFLLLAMLLILRKKLKAHYPGPSRHWLPVHVYAGLLFALFSLLHTGASYSSLFGGLLFWSGLITVVSGLWGHLVRRKLPVLMRSRVARPSLLSRLDELIELRQNQVMELAGRTPGAVETFARDLLPDYYRRWNTRSGVFMAHGRATLEQSYKRLAKDLNEDQKRLVNEMEVTTGEIYQLFYQKAADFILQAWLFVHLPFALALLSLVLAHLRVML